MNSPARRSSSRRQCRFRSLAAPGPFAYCGGVAISVHIICRRNSFPQNFRRRTFVFPPERSLCPALKYWLKGLRKKPESSICPKNWVKKWKALRSDANLGRPWVQDVLRHTFASYYMKRYKNLPRLQSQMGHADLTLLRTRYVNMNGIKKCGAKIFFAPPDILHCKVKDAGD